LRQTRQFTVKGKVQGVWFRDSTRREAESLRITGYARNLANGDVAVLASGDSDALDALERWLHDGPPLARVDEVLKKEKEYQPLTGFEVA
jgi:acylphosphatase